MQKLRFSSPRVLLLAGAASLTALAGTVPALAQDGDSASVLADIVVTAQRRVENLQDVPLSVSAVGGERLDTMMGSGVDIRGMSGRIPSLNIESSFGRSFPRFYIRGYGNTDFDLNASQPVSLIYDEVVLENPILKGFPVFDLERVEVLRGPQGTLFGRNTPAGIVKFESRKPTQDFEGYASLAYGSFNNVDLEMAAGGALVEDVLAARISVLYQRQDDWVDNLRNGPGDDLEGFDEFAGRLQLLFTPSDQLNILLSGQMRKLDGTARLFRANVFTAGSNELNANYERDEIQLDGINFQELDTYNVTATINYDFGPATLTSVTAYWNGEFEGRGDIDGGFGASFLPEFGPGFIPFSANTQDNIPSLDQFTQELRLSSNGSGPLTWQGGFFYFDEGIDIETIDFAGPQEATGWAVAEQRQDSKAWGIFASASYDLTEQFRVTAGLRYSDDERTLTANRLFDLRPPFLTSGPLAAQTIEVDDSNVSWDVSANYFANDDVTLYARVASGYRAPSIQGRIAFGDTLSSADSEESLSFEAGVKSTLADGRARLNASVFYTDVKDLQLTAVGGGANFNRLINSDAELYGLEVELEARPVEPLLFTAGVSYNHTELTQPGLSTQFCGGGCTVTDPVVGGLAIIEGNPLPQAPEWTVNATLRYGVPVGTNGSEVYILTDWAYRSKVNFFLYEAVEFTGKSLLEGGLRLGFNNPDKGYELSAFVRNITDTDRAVGGIDFNNLTGFVNEPRTWGIEGRLNF